jgi:hypothetical protein
LFCFSLILVKIKVLKRSIGEEFLKLCQIIGLNIVALFYYYLAAILYASTNLSDLEEKFQRKQKKPS